MTNLTAPAIPLQPKAVNAYREVWRKIRDNGYDVIPLRGRDGPFKGWPAQPNDDAAISRWTGKAAGMRMYRSSAFVIDLDVRSNVVRETLVAVLAQRWPAFTGACLWRISGSTTLALIGQVSTARKRQWTARFKQEGGDGPPHLVECFTGNDKRYVAIHGYHSPGREYDYIGPSVLDVRLDELPWFPEADIPLMIAECERVMTVVGLEQIVVPKSAAYGEKVYDLEPEMVMTLSSGEKITLAALEKRAGANRAVKGFALWDPASKTPDRVLVNRGGGGLALWDTKHGVSHRWKSLAPDEDIELRKALRIITHPWEE